MSAIYKRSLGMTYNERALELEIGGGVSGYSTEEPVQEIRPLDLDKIDAYRTREELADIEIDFMLAEEHMQALAVEHPKYVWHVGRILSQRLDQLADEGKSVDAEMYPEAQALAEEIIAANPDKNAAELAEVVEAMVDMIQAEARLRHYTLAA